MGLFRGLGTGQIYEQAAQPTGWNPGDFWYNTSANVGYQNNNGSAATLSNLHVVSRNPGNQTGTASTALQKMDGQAAAFTPTTSGNVIVIYSFQSSNDTANDGGTATVVYGTGSAPANGASVTGTVTSIGGGKNVGNASQSNTITIIGVITGLTVNTAYWFDVQRIATGGGTFTLSGNFWTFIEF